MRLFHERWPKAFRIGLLLLLAGCGAEAEEGALRGSVSRIYSLSHDTVRARLSETELAIQYVDGGQVVVQVVLRAETLEGPATVDLAEHRVVGRREGTPLPDLQSGTLRLSAYTPSEGAAVRGDFDALLSSGDATLTLVGDFDVVLEDLR